MANFQVVSATTQIKSQPGKIKGIFVSSTTSGTLAVYDSEIGATTRPVITTFTPAAATMYNLSGDDGGISLSKGLYIVVANTISCTVIYE